MDEKFSIEKRLLKLEEDQRNPWRFFIQYILSPLLVVIIGSIMTYRVESGKKEMQEIQVASTMLPILFSDDKYKTFAAQRLWSRILKDEGLKAEIDSILKNYIMNRIENTLDEEKDMEAASDIYDAAKIFGGKVGESVVDSIEQNERRSGRMKNYRQVRDLKKSGYDAMLRDDFELAYEKFKEASELSPHFYTTKKVFLLLDSNKAKLNYPNTQAYIIREILDKYSWRMPDETFEALQSKIGVSVTRNANVWRDSWRNSDK